MQFSQEKFDYVVNFAAESHVDNSLRYPTISIHTNVTGTLNLLEACKKYGIERFHQISTDEVYGDLPLDRLDLKFNGNSKLNPSNPYSASKAMAEMLCRAYFRSYGINITISRCTNNYGKRQFPEKLIPMTIYKALYGENITIHGDGKNVRDWLLVDDHVAAIDLILHNGKDGEVYNVAGNNERSNISVVENILKHELIPNATIEFVPDRVGNDLRYALSTDKIERELGWKRTCDFEEGIVDVVSWYVNNIDWLNSIKDSSYKSAYVKKIKGGIN